MAVWRAGGQSWARIACSTPEKGVLSLVEGEIVPMKAAAAAMASSSPVCQGASPSWASSFELLAALVVVAVLGLGLLDLL